MLYFFLSYARGDDDAYVRKFFDELSKEVRNLTGDPSDCQVGFLDVRAVALGASWSPQLVTALSTSRAFVSLCSPGYFRRPACGKEWYIFQSRLIAHERETGEQVPALLPLIWTPTREMPVLASELQYFTDEMGDAYRREGLRQLVRLNRRAVRTLVSNLANRIVDVAARTDSLPSIASLPNFEEVPNAFASSIVESTISCHSRQVLSTEVLISYVAIDRMWAEWVANQLVNLNLTAVLQEVDSSSGSMSDFERRVACMGQAIVLLSREYAKAGSATRAWKLLIAKEPGDGNFLIVLRLDGGQLPAPFSERAAIELANLNEGRAQELLFESLKLPASAPPSTKDRAGGGGGLRLRYPAQPPPHWNVPQRNSGFTGRTQILEDLRDRLAGGVTAIMHHALYGLGGVGKTQIALEYAHRFASNYDVVWWISAEQPSLVQAALAELATVLRLPSGDSVQERVGVVLDALRQGKPFPRWLLIFDNADEPEDLRSLLPQGAGHVLVTSRNHAWMRLAVSVEVGVFQRLESVAHLCGSVAGLSEDDAVAVAESVGDLPLAIEQAGAWLAETAMPVHRYLDLLRNQPSRILQELLPAGYPRSVTATWLVSLDHLRMQTPAAARMLELCALLGPAPIPTWVLSTPRFVEHLIRYDDRLHDPMRHGRLVREIGRYALVSVDSERSSIEMHRLVQQVIRDQMDKVTRLTDRELIHRILAAANPSDSENPQDWHRYAELRPHLEPCRAVTSTDPEVRRLISDMVRYLWLAGDLKGCQELAEIAIQTWEEPFGPDDATTLMVRCNLANSLRSEARYDAALEIDRDVVERLTRTLGGDDAYTLVANGGLAADLRAKGDYRAAQRLDEHNFLRWRETFGEDHPRTLNAANNLALSMRFAGEFESVIAISEENLSRRRRIQGEQHLYTLGSANNYGRDLRDIGDLERSRDVLSDTLRQCQDALGEESPETWRAAKNLAVTLRKLGQFQAARTLTCFALSRFLERYGPLHPDTLACEMNLACDDSTLGDHASARDRAEDVLARQKRKMGADHPFSHVCANNLSIFTARLNEHQIATEVGREVVGWFHDHLGEKHPYTLSASVNLANHLRAAGDSAAARVLDETGYERMRRVWGEDHPSTVAAGHSLSLSLRAEGEASAADELRDLLLDRSRLLLGGDHPDTLAVAAGVPLYCDIELPPT